MEDIIYEKRLKAGWIIINRPQKHNAFRSKTIDEMKMALGDAERDEDIGTVVITGAGGKAFCAGGDIEEMKNLDVEEGRRFLLNFVEFLLQIRRCSKPVIAAVDGYCLGGGNEINIACDLTIATDRAVFGQTGPYVGSAPVIGGTQFLPFIVGDKKAREIVFLCNRYSAREAQEMGLVNKVVPPEKLEEEVNNWVMRIWELSPQALRIAKRNFGFLTDMLYSSFLHAAEMLSLIYGTEEFKEGMSAFLEKRKPNFRKKSDKGS